MLLKEKEEKQKFDDWVQVSKVSNSQEKEKLFPHKLTLNDMYKFIDELNDIDIGKWNFMSLEEQQFIFARIDKAENWIRKHGVPTDPNFRTPFIKLKQFKEKFI